MKVYISPHVSVRHEHILRKERYTKRLVNRYRDRRWCGPSLTEEERMVFLQDHKAQG